MPIYEYHCQNCHRKISLLMHISDYGKTQNCPVCGKQDLVRIISSFAIHKSLSTVYEESGDPVRGQSADYYKDPRNIGRGLEKRFKDMNIEIPDSIKQSIQEAREGKLPDSIKDLDNNASPDSAYH